MTLQPDPFLNQVQGMQAERLAAEEAQVGSVNAVEVQALTHGARRASWMLLWAKFAAGAWRAPSQPRCCGSCRWMPRTAGLCLISDVFGAG